MTGLSFIVTGVFTTATVFFGGLHHFYTTFLMQKKIYFKNLSLTNIRRLICSIIISEVFNIIKYYYQEITFKVSLTGYDFNII